MKYFKLIAICFLVSCAISLLGVFILSSVKYIVAGDTDFRTLPYGIAVAVNLCFGLATLPVFFNLNDRVRSSLVWSALSFFLLPVVFVSFFLLAMWNQPWPGILFCVPYVLTLAVSFHLFRKDMWAKGDKGN